MIIQQALEHYHCVINFVECKKRDHFTVKLVNFTVQAGKV